MTLLLLEALGALVILALIVWWTMFSGRKNGELRSRERSQEKSHEPVDNPPKKPPAE